MKPKQRKFLFFREKNKFKYLLLSTFIVCGAGISASHAVNNDGSAGPSLEPTAAQIAAEEAELAAWNQKEERIAQIMENKEQVINTIVNTWSTDQMDRELMELELSSRTAEELYQLESAQNRADIDAALFGVSEGSSDGLDSSEAIVISRSTADLTYTPVDPCRFLDTRIDNYPTDNANGVKGYYRNSASHIVYIWGSAGTIGTTQGGSSTGCSLPSGTPTVYAAALNMTVVPKTKGHLRVYPGNLGSAPNVSFLNFNTPANFNIANAGIVKTYLQNRIRIFVFSNNALGAHVIGDLNGVFGRINQLNSTNYNWHSSSDVNFPVNSTACRSVNNVLFNRPGKGFVDVQFDTIVRHRNLGYATTHIETASNQCNSVGNFGYRAGYSWFGSGAAGNRGVPHTVTRRYFYSGAGSQRYYFNVSGWDNGSVVQHYLDNRAIRIHFTPVK